MSVQEERLKAIADAIRDKDGTTEPISAKDFAVRIRAIENKSEFAIPLVVASDNGAAITAVNGDRVLTTTIGETGRATLILSAPGVWAVTASMDGKEKSVDVEAIEGYNAEFSLSSRLPGGYTEIEYIQSGGDEYIDTGILPKSSSNLTDTRVVMDIQPLNDAGDTEYYFGTYCSYYNYNTKKTWYSGYYIYRAYSGNYGAIDAAATISNTKINDSSTDRVIVILDGPNKKAYIEETVATMKLYTVSSIPSIYLLKCNGQTGHNITAKLFSCQIEQNGSLVRDFVPCTAPSGAVGLYDMVEGIFYENAGTGAFVAGPSAW